MKQRMKICIATLGAAFCMASQASMAQSCDDTDVHFDRLTNAIANEEFGNIVEETAKLAGSAADCLRSKAKEEEDE